MSRLFYTLFLTLVTVIRMVELRQSQQNQQALAVQGVPQLAEPRFHRFVLLHIAVLIGALAEVNLSKRRFIPWLGIPALMAFLLSTALPQLSSSIGFRDGQNTWSEARFCSGATPSQSRI